MTYYQNRKKIIAFLVFGLVGLVLLVIFSAAFGAADISYKDVGAILVSKLPLVSDDFLLKDILKVHLKIINELRLPRIALAVMVGSLLAGSGTVYQSVFRNPMADPFVLGVSSGAAVGAACGLIWGWSWQWLGFSSVNIFAFVGALITTYAVYTIASSSGKTPVLTLVLTGIAMSFMLSSALSLLITFNRDQLEQIIFWSYGSLSTSGWREVLAMLPFFLIAVTYYATKGRVLNILTLGEESASSLGVDVEAERKKMLVVASLATAAAVAVTGIIGFVGLVIPHVCRLISGPDNRSLLPFSMLGGAYFMVACDIVARMAIAPSEIPIGIITSAIGAPYFIYLIARHKRRGSRI